MSLEINNNDGAIREDTPYKKGQVFFLIAIGFFYIYYSFTYVFVEFFNALFCIMGCNNVNRLAQKEIILAGGFFVLAVIEAYGLVKRQWWARVFGVVLPLLLLAQSFFILDSQYIDNESLKVWDILFSHLHSPRTWLLIVAPICLFIPKITGYWKHNGLKPLVFLITFSLIGIALTVVNWQNYSNTNLSTAISKSNAINSLKEPPETVVVSAGSLHKNKYFQLTIPAKTSVTYLDGSETDILFDAGSDLKSRGFEASINVAYDMTLDSLEKNSVKFLPSWKTVTSNRINISGVPALRSETVATKDGEEFSRSINYMVIRNGRFFSFKTWGDSPIEGFDSTMMTLRFTDL